jgi:radical SAM superfamily enzyme YgiQ (UPF0313 family)
VENLLTGPTKCLLVRPEFLDDTFYSMDEAVALLGAKSAAPPLGLLTMAALLPEHWELRCIDEDVEPVTDADVDWADIVMISGIGSQQNTMLRIIERAHAVGKLTVVGGSGVALQPDFLPEADFVVAGEAEDTVPRLLEDLGQGKTSGTYISTHKADLHNTPVPRYDLAKLDKYMMVGLAFARGCPFSCEFCAQIEIFGKKTRTKKPEQVIEELQTLYDLGYRGMVDFGFDNLIGDIPQAEAALEAMAAWSKEHGYPFHYSTEATMNLARQPKVLKLMQDNDFRMVFIGIESGDEEVLERTKKGQNTGIKPSDAIRVVNEHGMLVNTGLILGFDGETPETAGNIINMLRRTGAFPSLILPLHALPGTALQRRLREEGRLFADGVVAMNTTRRTDTATTGLNFVTERPRAQIQRDLVRVLEDAYDPGIAYDRIRLTIDQIDPRPRYKPSIGEMLIYLLAFVKIAFSIGLRKATRWRFWKAFFRTLFTKPRALDRVITMAVMNDNYARQSVSYIEALKIQIDYVESTGEETFNREMLATDATPRMLDAASS